MENEDKKVSIVTASYNYQEYIKETIESVINQTIPNWEMIIVDDGSTDNSIAVIKSYCEKDNRIKLFQHENAINKGLAETVQLGIKKASTEWIIFLESDDTIEPNYIEEKLKVIEENPDVKFIFNDINMFGDKTVIKTYGNYFEKARNMLSDMSYPLKLKEAYKEMNIIPTFSCVMLHKDVLNGIDWKSPIKKSLDYYLWSQIITKFNTYYLDKKLTNWRMSKSSYINQEAVPIKQYMLFVLDIMQNINEGTFVKGDFLYFIDIIEKYWKKYIKYKKLFKSILIISILECLILLAFIVLLCRG